MKFRFFRFLFFLSLIGLLASCLSTTTQVISTDASFVSLTLAGNDSVNKAVFTLDGTTIVNLDSLPYKSKIDSVYPTFTFKSTAASFLHVQLDKKKYKFLRGSTVDSIYITGSKDTIDMRQPNLWIRNFASDKKTSLRYSIKLNVHQVNPNLYKWGKIADSITSVTPKNQKTIIMNDVFYWYMNDGSQTYLYTSTDGKTWNATTVTGLPVATSLVDMIQFNGKLYLTRDGANLYTSADGVVWKQSQPSSMFNFNSLAFVLNNQLWAVVQPNPGDGTYHFAISNDGISWNMTKGTVPAYFPVIDFASVTFKTLTGKGKVVIVGGFASNGNRTLSRWSSEDGVYWVDFSSENLTLPQFLGAPALIHYDNKLLVLGEGNDIQTVYKQSVDEGYSWQVPDTALNKLPANFKPRKNASFVVFKPKDYPKANPSILGDSIRSSNYIYIIGGNTETSPMFDVWKGKVNKKNFLRQ